MAMVQDQNRAYITGLTDGSKYVNSAGQEDAILNVVLKEIGGKRGFRVVNQADFTVKSGKGRQVLMTREDAELQVYAVVRNSRVMMVAFCGVHGTSASNEATKFVRSFKLASN